jgi:hypothetical protein
MRPARLLLLAALLLSVVSCGGSGGPTLLLIGPEAAFDAFMSNAGTIFNGFGQLVAGDESDNSHFRFYFAFDLSPLPAGASIVSAAVQVGQVNVLGAPYPVLGSVSLDLVDLGVALDGADFSSAPLTLTPPALLSSSAALGTKVADVTALLLDALALGMTRFDLRGQFTFSTDSDFGLDVAHFASIESGTPALLVIEFN